MRKYYKGIVLIIFIMSCTKPIAKQENATNSKEPILIEQDNNANELKQIEELSMDNLIGKWLLLNSEGEIDSSGSYLLIKKLNGEYSGVLVFEGNIKKCIIMQEEKNINLFAETGEHYEISRIRSINVNENNGIGLSLIVENIDDITLGIFQLEDVLKKVKTKI